jgi:hypothetical protein
VLHTGKSGDGGIDLILLDSNDGNIPIQVKRRTKTRKAESVTIVRELRGAMVLSGHDEGMIVTTAPRFSKPAVEASQPHPEHLVPQRINLVDCRRLLDIIGVTIEAQRAT